MLVKPCDYLVFIHFAQFPFFCQVGVLINIITSVDVGGKSRMYYGMFRFRPRLGRGAGIEFLFACPLCLRIEVIPPFRRQWSLSFLVFSSLYDLLFFLIGWVFVYSFGILFCCLVRSMHDLIADIRCSASSVVIARLAKTSSFLPSIRIMISLGFNVS